MKKIYYSGKQLREVEQKEILSNQSIVKNQMKQMVTNHAAVHSMRAILGIAQNILVWKIVSPNEPEIYVPAFAQNKDKFKAICSQIDLKDCFSAVEEERIFVENQKPYFLKKGADGFEIYEVTAFFNSDDIYTFIHKRNGFEVLNVTPVCWETKDADMPQYYCWYVKYSFNKQHRFCFLPFYVGKVRCLKRDMLIPNGRKSFEDGQKIMIGTKQFIVSHDEENDCWTIILLQA